MSELNKTKRDVIRRMRDEDVRIKEVAAEAKLPAHTVNNWAAGRLNGEKGLKIMQAAERVIARKVDTYRKIRNAIQ